MTTAVFGLGVFGQAIYGVGDSGLFVQTDPDAVVYEYTVLPTGRHWAVNNIAIVVPIDKTVHLKLQFLNKYLQAIDAPYVPYNQNTQNWSVHTQLDIGSNPDKLVFVITTNNKGSINRINFKYDIWQVRMIMVGVE